jgi:hypothetical protein
MREIRRRTRLVDAFPDGRSVLMLVAPRLRVIAAPKWDTKQYLRTKPWPKSLPSLNYTLVPGHASSERNHLTPTPPRPGGRRNTHLASWVSLNSRINSRRILGR